MGSSHTFYGVDPALFESKGFNLSHISQSVDWDYELLKKYESRWKNLKRVYVPIDYFTLFSRISTGPDPWRTKNYSIYYGFFQFDSVSGNSEILSLHLKSNLLRLFSHYVKKKSERSCTDLGFAKVKRKQADLEKTGIAAAKRHKKEKTKTLFGEDEVLVVENALVVENIAKLMASEEVEVIFYTSPAFETYTSRLDAEQLELTRGTMTSLVEKYPNTRFVEFMNSPEFRSEDFRDADHLNQKGAEKFTLMLRDL